MIPIKYAWLQPPRLVLLLFTTTALSQLLPALRVHATEPATPRIDFGRQVRPILSSKCFKCHGPDEAQREADLRLDKADLARAKAIVPGNADKSLLIQRITSDDPESRMPPPDSNLVLTEAEISLLEQWVVQGADYSIHWAFQKPKRPDVPNTDYSSWSRNEIDAFILKGLDRAALEPSAEADKVTLIRRLSLDLTGLPPPIAEVDRFLGDKRTQAYERLVDRLLASQHYGERMAQDWLDVARYGDTNGYESDSDRQMWLYRDWVINAFNTNMPFDRFTLEQIAGDMLPDADHSQRIASGFNRNTTYNEEGGADADEFRVVYAVERASTTGTVFLGLTIGCAQCHEHKYDPISQKEFYQFYAFFNSVDGELGATGHDIPLPPLLTLPTKQQAAELDRVTKGLAELETRIKAEVGKVELAIAPATTDQTVEPAPDSKASTAEEKEAGDETFFETQAAWEANEKKQEESKLPKEIRELVTLESVKRNDEQNQKLRDYFVEHAYARTRCVFEPLHKSQAELKKTQAELNKAIPSTMVMKEATERNAAFVLIRGDFEQKGEQVAPGVPAIFPPLPDDQPRNRVALARWLAGPDNPLVARVAVNRFWNQLFGTGLVKTMEDFGVRGDFPSHPELLDWLATEFIRNGWNVKALQKQIVMSAAYRQSSRFRPEAAKVDPYNRLLARQNRFRLAAEGIRDTALAVSGLLNDEIGGPSVFPYQPEGYYGDKGRWKWNPSKGNDLYRRGLYTFWRRTTMYPTFRIFDAPSRETCTVDRPRTNTPLQALVTLNDPTFVEAARVFGERIMRQGGNSVNEKLAFAFRSTLARVPDQAERQILEQIYTKQLARYLANKQAAADLIQHGEKPVPNDLAVPQLATWSTVANVLLNLDETITRD